MDALESLTSALVELDEQQTMKFAAEVAKDSSSTPSSVLRACQQAMRIVGERYGRGQYYLSGLILAGDLFNEVLTIVQSESPREPDGDSSASVVLGTVAGDIHDIGKNMFGSVLQAVGFEVVDLGVDIPKERFLEATRDHRPDVLCLSGLITTAFHSMRHTVEFVRKNVEKLGYSPPIVIGGGTIDDDVWRYTGADSWSADAWEGVRICETLVQSSGGSKPSSSSSGSP